MPVQALDIDVLTHWDELDFVDILGTRICILRLDGANDPSDAVLLAVWYEPNLRVPAHSHARGHVEVILEGSLRVGERMERQGSMRVVPPGFAYGPLVAGPEGCKALEFFPDLQAFLATEIVDPEEFAALVSGDGDDPATLQSKLERLVGGAVPNSLFAS